MRIARAILLLVATCVFGNCSKIVVSDTPINKDALAKEVTAQKDEVIAKLEFCLKYWDLNLGDPLPPVRGLIITLGRFQDKVVLNFLKEISQKHTYRFLEYVCGLARQGEEGRKILERIKRDELKLNLTPEEREASGRNVSTHGGGINQTLAEVITDHLKYAKDIDIQKRNIDIGQFVKVFCKRYTEQELNFLVVSKNKIEEWEKEYLGDMPDMETSKIYIKYPDSIFENATFSSICEALAGKDSDKRFAAAIISGYWGLDIGREVLLEEVEKRHRDCPKCDAVPATDI